MAVHYDFIAYSRRTSATNWIIGMKAIRGEVPLDIVVPDSHTTSDADNPEVVAVLTTEGLERESTDGLELYHYLRRLNPKKNEAFNYNEVVIRNIHSRLNALPVNQELRVQITYMERREPYTRFSYQIKLLGISGKPNAEIPNGTDAQTTRPLSGNRPQQLTGQRGNPTPNKPIYRTTNTIENLISFTQNLQKELNQTQKHLGVVINKVQQLQDEQQQFRQIHNLLEDILERITHLETWGDRIQYLETDRHQLQDLQHVLRKFLIGLNQQTRISLQEQDEITTDEEDC